MHNHNDSLPIERLLIEYAKRFIWLMVMHYRARRFNDNVSNLTAPTVVHRSAKNQQRERERERAQNANMKNPMENKNVNKVN